MKNKILLVFILLFFCASQIMPVLSVLANNIDVGSLSLTMESEEGDETEESKKEEDKSKFSDKMYAEKEGTLLYHKQYSITGFHKHKAWNSFSPIPETPPPNC